VAEVIGAFGCRATSLGGGEVVCETVASDVSLRLRPHMLPCERQLHAAEWEAVPISQAPLDASIAVGDWVAAESAERR
jgi:hypothetical protein